MKIIIDSYSMSYPVMPVYCSVFNPKWRWTSAKGREYSIVNDEITPEPEIRTVRMDGEIGDCWEGGCSGWYKTEYYDPDTGEEIRPSLQRNKIHIPGTTPITGAATIEDYSDSDLDDSFYGRQWCLSDPEVVVPKEMAGASGKFYIQRVGKKVFGKVEADLLFDTIVFPKKEVA